jgi:hypothetical protein
MRAKGLQGLRNAARGERGFALVCLLLVVFVLQGAVTRGHFHLGAAFDAAGPQLAGDVDPGPAGNQKKPLPPHDETHCLLWHAAGVCGAAVAADAAKLFVPASARLRIAVDERPIFPERFAAAWRSRAPPAV